MNMQRRRWTGLLKSLLLVLTGALLVLVAAVTVYINTRPALDVWHENILEGEFTAQTKLASFEDYLRLEDGLFARLKGEVVDQVLPQNRTHFNRFSQAKPHRSAAMVAELEPQFRAEAPGCELRSAAVARLFRQPLQPAFAG